MSARSMSNDEWMRHMRGRLRGLQVLCIVAMVGALVGWLLW